MVIPQLISNYEKLDFKIKTFTDNCIFKMTKAFEIKLKILEFLSLKYIVLKYNIFIPVHFFVI